MRKIMARALTIAGSDSGGGAGLQADLKTFSAFGVFGMSAVTAVTVQNTLGVTGVQVIDPDIVEAQIRVVVEDIGVNAVKTGMLANASIVRVVADLAGTYRFPFLIVDPVMRAKSGDPLLEPDAEQAYRDALIPRATLVTPNIPEAEALTGMTIRTRTDMERAAEHILAFGCKGVVIKGGHLEAEPDHVYDLFFDGHAMHWLSGTRLKSPHTHGTGCTFASAIAAGLARGWNTLTSICTAKAYVEGAIRHAPGYGSGHGPLNHLWYGRIPFDAVVPDNE